jgi:RNA-directed DNA polymerase
MRELDDEGVAIHVGPESCGRVCEGAGEALTGVRAGWAIEPRKLNKVRGADAVILGGRPHRQRRYRESLWDPARSENLRTYGICMRENREVP